MRPLIVAVILLGLTPVDVSVQSLGELARREEARRQAIATPAPVYTNADLKAEPAPAQLGVRSSAARGRVPANSSSAAASEARAEAQSPRSSESAASMADDESAWRARMTTARTALARAGILRDALQSRINALNTDFVNRDDPVQRNQIATDRQSALAELERMTEEIERHRKSIDTIEEEARRAGVPPGWLR